MIAYHFPPLHGSSGIQRTLRFVQHLPRFGWHPTVLSVSPRAYPKISDDQLSDIPDFVKVWRPLTLDAARDLSLFGRYIRMSAIPDRWVTWIFAGVYRGLQAIREGRINAIWSTYPIASAHLLALILHRITGLPWIADFRDPMVLPDFPEGRLARRVQGWIEAATLSRCTKAVFVTPGAADIYRRRFPDLAPERVAIIANGYDEESFPRRIDDSDDETIDGSGPLRLVHSGLIYRDDRNPLPLLKALSALKHKGIVSRTNLQLTFRASGQDQLLKGFIEELNISDIVSLAESIPYRSALKEMLEADALLLLQGSACNHQIPAKLYEYFRARRPILALTDKHGDTANALKHIGIDTIVPLHDSDEIESFLPKFIDQVRRSAAPTPALEDVERHSREQRSLELATLLRSVTNSLALKTT